MKRLHNGDLVFILNRNSSDKTSAIKGRVLECVCKAGEKYNAYPEYRVISQKGDEYFILYPESGAPLYLLTKQEYIEHLKLMKNEITERIEKLNRRNSEIEEKIYEIEHQVEHSFQEMPVIVHVSELMMSKPETKNSAKKIKRKK